MNTFRRLLILVIFAAIGVGCAVIVGNYSTLAHDPEKTPSTELAEINYLEKEDVVYEEKKEPQKEVPSMLPLISEPALTLPPPPVEPVGPIIAQPQPLKGQEFTPLPPPQPSEEPKQELKAESGKSVLPEIMKFLHERLTVPSQQMGATASLPAGNQAQKPQVKSTIKGEGDGKLRIHIYDEDLRKVLDLLGEQGNLNILASKSVEGKVSATLNGVDIDSALDAILKSTGYVAKREGNYVFVGTPDDFSTLEQSLDKIGTRVYQPNYITAGELKTLITPLLSDKVGIISVSSPAEAGIAFNDSGSGGNKFAGNEVLVVRDYEAVLGQVDQMVEEVDIRPLQVSIEAMILSIKLKDNDKFGVNFQLLRDQPHVKFGIGKPLDTLAAFKLDEGGLKFGFLDSSLGAFLNAVETVGDTNVVANPRVMVLNKHRADIQIGEQKGYISTTVTETSATQAVQFLDLGAQLRIRPFVTTDGLIRMEIHPELSDGDVKTENGFTLPNKTVTQVTSNIMVRDGCTVIIGGLIRDQVVNNITQVPFFGSLPVVGIAFRSTDETIERHEVLILITPRIVYEPGTCQEGEKAACEYYRRHGVYAEKMSPFGKRSIGRRYFRLAQAAWADGDQKKALRFAEMSVQFDPVNRAAIDLRSDIWLGKPQGDHTLGAERPVPELDLAAKNPLDGQAVADWVMNDLEHPAAPPMMPLHPIDRGQPGSSQEIPRAAKLP